MFCSRLLGIFTLFLSTLASKATLKDTTLHHLEHLNLQHGYPVDAFGGMFATFAVKAQGRHGDICFIKTGKYEGASRRCQRAIQALHGVYGARDYNRIMRNNSHWPYGVGETREANTRTMQSWTQHLFKQTWMYIPIYLQHDLVPERRFSRVSGLITTERLVAIREVMEKCVEALAKPLKAGEMQEWACGYANFLAIMHESRANIPRDCVQVAPRNDSQSMSDHHDRIYGMQICRNIDSGVGENGEMLEGYATLTDQAYECVCRKGYVWSKETKSCVLEDGCGGESKCDPRGTRMCVSSVVNLPNSLSLPFVCLCFSGFMGARCEKRRDACIEVRFDMLPFLAYSRSFVDVATASHREINSATCVFVRWVGVDDIVTLPTFACG
ncbi:epidermal growth factor [Echinococcus granulosus]|uniref:Epidermal growth factor n=1 Tax=Echinococcus granulosus TaxID=6210 RepID=W6U475_ECHGR|nr:epidermal growth factor [Echinococcus granulosus]EUB55401.1 epidermal growth factor [Echinococcus granulosus]